MHVADWLVRAASALAASALFLLLNQQVPQQSDPPFGIAGNYEGIRATPELPQAVYRIDPSDGRIDQVIDDLAGPNGLCFSPDESRLYVVESRAQPSRLVWAYDVDAQGRLANKRRHIDAEGPGALDGIACDEDGNLWCGWGMGAQELDGVMVFAPDGRPIGRIALPERCANLCFGGRHRNRLFMAASRSLYALYVNAKRAAGG